MSFYLPFVYHATLCLFAGEVTGAEEQVAASIATVQQATSFASDPNIQYHFRTENNGGQVHIPIS